MFGYKGTVAPMYGAIRWRIAPIRGERQKGPLRGANRYRIAPNRSELVGLNTYDEVVEFLERKIDDLHQQAYRIVEQHWASVRQMENKHPGWENKSSLQLRCEKQGNSIRLDWCGIKWYGSRAKGNRKPIRVHIAKPRGSHCYTISKLLVFAKEWEKALVEDTERRMAEIRREASHLVKAIASIRYARAVAAKSGGLDSERTREGL